MALVLADRVKETTTTTGTATYTLSGAETGFESFGAIGDGNQTYYCCTDGTDFEVGIGTYTASGTTLARTVILQSSNSDSAVSWSSGSKNIFCTQPAEKAVFLDASGHIIASDGRNLTNVDAATLDSLDSGSFLRSDAADTKTSGDLTFSDDVKALFGTGSDLEIYHDGSNSFIRELGTGRLLIDSNGTGIDLRKNASENLAKFITDGAVELYHDNSKKLETTSSGATITGTAIVTDNLQMQGNTYTNFSDWWGSGDNSAFFTPYGYLGSNGSFAVSLFSNGYRNQSGGFTSMGINSNSTASGIELMPTGEIKFRTGTPSGTTVPQRMSLTNTGLDITGTLVADKLQSDDVQINGTSNDFPSETGNAHIIATNNGGSFPFNESGSILYRPRQNDTDGRGNHYFYTGATPTLRQNIKANGDIAFYASDGTSQNLFWDASTSRLGINNTSPSTAVDITGVLTADGVDVGDDERIRLGASQDLQLYHDGSNSYIQDAGTGAIIFISNIYSFRNAANTEQIARFDENGAVELYHDNSKKLETTSTGIKALGNINLEPNSGSFRNIGFDSTDNTTLVLAGGGSSGVTAGNIELSRAGDIFIDGSTIRLRTASASSTYAQIDSSGASITGDLTLTSTDAGATENPTLDLYRNSASPADSDVLGHINFSGENSAGEKIVYAEVESAINDQTDGTEDGEFIIRSMLNGTLTKYYSAGFGSNIMLKPISFTAGASTIFFEGTTNNTFETSLTVTDPTSDNTITLPDATGTVLLNTGDQSITGNLTLTATDDGSGSTPELKLVRQSASPADFDYIGGLSFFADNSADQNIEFGTLEARLGDVTDGTEDFGGFELFGIKGGTARQRFMILGQNTIEIHNDQPIVYRDITSTHDLTISPPSSLSTSQTITLPDATGTVALNESGILNLTNSGSQSELRLYCESSNAHYAALKAPAHSAFSGNVDITLPATAGTLALTSSNITGNAATATTATNSDTVDNKHISVVTSLPSSPDPNTIYFVTG